MEPVGAGVIRMGKVSIINSLSTTCTIRAVSPDCSV